MNVRGRFGLIVSLIYALGCNSSTDPLSSVDIDGSRISLVATASGGEIVGTSPVTFTVRLVNEGAKPVTLHFNSGCQMLPYIRSSIGRLVLPDGGWDCTGALTQLTLAAGESVVREYVWTGSTDFRSEMPLRPLPPGRYFFSAEVPAQEAALRSRVVEVVVR